ncbi:MAG: metallophosphoesterase [Kiritimatiellae bacterium]|nr:metallophosphoesterase [Kiritimatiellia bacterium]
MMKNDIRLMVLGLLLFPTLTFCAAIDIASYGFGPEPRGRVVTFAAGAASRGFAWQTDTSVTESEVRLVPGTAQPADFASAPLVYTGTCTAVALPTTHCHRVMIDRLPAGTYSCRLGGAGHYAYGRLDVRAPGAAVTVVNFNDFQTSNPDKLCFAERAMAASVKAVGGADKVDFLLSGGDFVDGWLRKSGSARPIVRVGRSVEWGVACDTVAANYPSAPLVSSSGNHDFNDYGDRMPIRYPEGLFPGCESLDYGNVHVATIPFAAGVWHERYARIYAWLDSDLATSRARGKSDWTVVCTHWGPNTTGDHAILEPATTNFSVRLGELCAKHRVDLVLQAHDHTFSKTLPYRWSGKGWTTAERDVMAVDFAPGQAVLDGEPYDADPMGTYYLSAGCLGHRVGENVKFACPTGTVSYSKRAYRIETGTLAVDSKWGRKGDAASADLPRSMFGVLHVEGRRLSYDWYVVEQDGTYELYDKLRVAKRTRMNNEEDEQVVDDGFRRGSSGRLPHGTN